MRKIILSIYLLPILLLSGCNFLTGGGEDFPPEPDVEHYIYISNNSSHQIVIKTFFFDGVQHNNTIMSGSELEIFNEIFEDQIPFLPDEIDSSYVTYDTGITVVHTKEEVQNVSRSIWLRSSYTGGKVNDKLYEIYYTFTDADYDEAVLINEGG